MPRDFTLRLLLEQAVFDRLARRAPRQQTKPGHILRALLRSYSVGARLPAKELLDLELARLSRKPDREHRGPLSKRFSLRLDFDLHERLDRRRGAYPLSVIARALLAEYLVGRRDVSIGALEAERIHETTRRAVERGERKVPPSRTHPRPNTDTLLSL